MGDTCPPIQVIISKYISLRIWIIHSFSDSESCFSVRKILLSEASWCLHSNSSDISRCLPLRVSGCVAESSFRSLLILERHSSAWTSGLSTRSSESIKGLSACLLTGTPEPHYNLPSQLKLYNSFYTKSSFF